VSYIDIVLLIFLLWAAIRGFIKGFIKEAAALLALILGIYAAAKFSGYAGQWLAKYIHTNPQTLSVISFILTFTAVVIVIYLLGAFFDWLAKAVALGPVNRILGVLFGVLKTAFILSVIILVINTIQPYFRILPEQEIARSKMYKPLSVFAPAVLPVLTKGYFILKPDSTNVPENKPMP